MPPLAWSDLGIYFVTMLGVWLIPVPLWVPTVTMLATKTLPPWAVATAGALAAGLDALFDYWMVRRAFRWKTLDQVRKHPMFSRAEKWAAVAPFLTVMGFASVPLPFVLVRVLVPISGYPRWRYVAAVTLGRFPRIFVVAAFGSLVDVPRPWLIAGLVAGAVVGAVTFIAKKLGWLGDKPAPTEPPPASEKHLP